MAETLPSPTEKTVVANTGSLCRLWTLTIASLTLNALILLLLVVGAIIHHHREQQDLAGRGGHGGGHFAGHCQFGGGPRFHHFGGPGWGRQGGFGGNQGGSRFGGGFGRGPGGPGAFAGGPGMGGMHGMMGGSMGKPDPAKMTDMILNHLSQKLTLTDDEKAKIKPIIEQQIADIQKQVEAQRAAIQKQVEDTRAKIKPLLTSDQQKQLDAMPLPGQKPAGSNEANQPASKPGE